MTRDRIESIKARVEAASEGPWRLERAAEGFPPFRVIQDKYDPNIRGAEHGEDGYRYIAEASGFGNWQANNAAFIAHARQDIPWLLTRIAELEAENARMKSGRYERGDVWKTMVAAQKRAKELEAENARLREAVGALVRFGEEAHTAWSKGKSVEGALHRFMIATTHPAVKEVLGREGK